MTLQDDKIMRHKIPDRMMSTTFTLPIDNRKVVGIVNYVADDNGITPLALWVKIKPTDSYIDRELRASGKMISLLLQYGCSFKEVAETLTKDSIVGSAVTYLHKNLESILSGEQGDKVPKLNTDPYKIKDVG